VPLSLALPALALLAPFAGLAGGGLVAPLPLLPSATPEQGVGGEGLVLLLAGVCCPPAGLPSADVAASAEFCGTTTCGEHVWLQPGVVAVVLQADAAAPMGRSQLQLLG
jgi:hypothetical protein